MERTGRTFAACAGAVIMVWAFMSITSCSGPGTGEAPSKPPAPSSRPKSPPARQDARKDADPDRWVACGSAKDGVTLYYDAKNIERSGDHKVVKFWTRVAPPKNAALFTEGQKLVEKGGKDPRLLEYFHSFHEANCPAMTYDLTKMALFSSDGTLLIEQAVDVRGRRPGPDVKGLIEKLCARPAEGAARKGGAKTGAPCESAGIMVLIEPQEAIQAGAQWRVEGKEWKKSGEAACGLPVDESTRKGSYRIEYKALPGTPFVPPETHDATVSSEYGYSFYTSLYTSRPQKDRKAP